MNISDERAWELARAFIREQIEAARKRETPEAFTALGLDPHLQNCVDWLHKIDNAPRPGVRIATYGHDLDRALVDRVRLEDHASYEQYKKEHAIHSARVLCEHLIEVGASEPLIREVGYLVRHHDNPGAWVGKTADLTLGLTLVKSADGLSFFEVNFDNYMKQIGDLEKIRGKMHLMYTKMCGRAFEETRAGVSRRLSSEIQPEVSARVEELQCQSEELVLPYYERALKKVEEASRLYDPRRERETQAFDIRKTDPKPPNAS